MRGNNVAGFTLSSDTSARLDAGSLFIGTDQTLWCNSSKTYNTTPYTRFNIEVAGLTMTNSKGGVGPWIFVGGGSAGNTTGWTNFTGTISIDITTLNISSTVKVRFSVYQINNNGRKTGTVYRMWFS